MTVPPGAHHSAPMKKFRIGAIGLGFWLAASHAMAQPSSPPKGPGKPPQIAAPKPPPAPPAPASTPDEMSHQAMVEEQERRDREAEAERDRNDL